MATFQWDLQPPGLDQTFSRVTHKHKQNPHTMKEETDGLEAGRKKPEFGQLQQLLGAGGTHTHPHPHTSSEWSSRGWLKLVDKRSYLQPGAPITAAVSTHTMESVSVCL